MTGPGFDENRDKFRRVVRTEKGPLYIERHEAPMLPPIRWRALAWAWVKAAAAWLFGIAVQTVALAAGIVAIAWWAHDHTDRSLLIVGVACVGLFVVANDWAHRRGVE